MADTVTTRIISQNLREITYMFLNTSDGTGEAAVTKIDVSTLTSPAGTCQKLSLLELWWNCVGMDVNLLFDADTDDRAATLAGSGHMDLEKVGGIPDPRSAGATGDLKLTTVGHTLNDTYFIVVRAAKLP